MGGSTDAWTRYWASGAEASLGLAGSATEAAFAAHWRRWFDALPAGARVVDLGSGNGALVRHALGLDGARVDPMRVVHAVDAAALAPGWLDAVPEAAARVRWHPATRMEATPIASATIDAACSQFGFEYADEEGAIAELGRITRVGARLSLLVHHDESEVLRRGRAERVALQALLSAGGLFDVAKDVAIALQARREGGWVDEDARRRYNAAQGALDRRAAANADEGAAIDDVRRAVHQALGAVAGGASVDALGSVREAFVATAQRLDDLAGATRDEGGIARMLGRLRATGWACRAEEFVTSEGRWAWRLEGGRESSA